MQQDFVNCLITKITNNKVVDLMKSSYKKTFVYMPMLGFIEAADNEENPQSGSKGGNRG